MSKLIIALTCLILAACGSSPVQPETQQSASAPKFHAFGDSYTAGTVIDGDTAAGRKGYVAEIATHLGLPVINHGVGGTIFTSGEEAGAILSEDFTASDIVTMQIGFNDDFAYGDSPAYIALFKSKLIAALSHLKKSGCRVYVGKTIEHTAASIADAQARGLKLTATSVRAYLNAIDEAISEVSGDNIHVVDTHAAFDSTDASLMDRDNVHPNVAGYHVIAKAFIAEMEKR